MPEVLAVYTAHELLEAQRERRRPVPEAVVDEWPRRSVVRILDRQASDVYDGRDL